MRRYKDYDLNEKCCEINSPSCPVSFFCLLHAEPIILTTESVHAPCHLTRPGGVVEILLVIVSPCETPTLSASCNY